MDTDRRRANTCWLPVVGIRFRVLAGQVARRMASGPYCAAPRTVRVALALRPAVGDEKVRSVIVLVEAR